ncbi:hypothetical protein GCM10009641_84990 [Mycobacterium cookii]|uniref:Uncharacterized protein n=1 Tax=Nocardioides furvisabuli TaxID=375542 RepID=A0ABP5IJ54_9ACTN
MPYWYSYIRTLDTDKTLLTPPIGGARSQPVAGRPVRDLWGGWHPDTTTLTWERNAELRHLRSEVSDR